MVENAMSPRFWLPPVIWMGLLLLGSGALLSEPFTARLLIPILRGLFPWAQPETLRLLHFLLRKLGHLIEYAVLALLWYRAFFRGCLWTPGRATVWTLAISIAYAILDEVHQGLTTVRTGSPGDVVLDGTGMMLALSVRLWGWERWLQRATTFFLWTACLGGGGILLVDLWLEISSGWVWITTPLAAAILIGRRWLGPAASLKST
jgi:VanZ family protein